MHLKVPTALTSIIINSGPVLLTMQKSQTKKATVLYILLLDIK